MREEHIVLEHVPDAALLGRHPRTCGRVVEHDVVDHHVTRVERHEPCERTQQRRLASAIGSEDDDRLGVAGHQLDGEIELAELDTDVGVEGHVVSQRSRSATSTASEMATSTRLSAIAASGPVFEREEDRERHRLGLALEVAGERDRGAELAECPGPRQRGAGGDRRRDQRKRDPSEARPATRTECGRGVFVAPVEPAQRGLDRDHEERHRDERLRHDRPADGERKPQPDPVVEVLADNAATAEREEQGHPAHHRWQDHRQDHERSREAPARELDAREHPGKRRTPNTIESSAAASEQMSDNRNASVVTGIAQLVPDLGPRRPHEHSDDRQREERNRDGRDDDGRGREAAARYALRKPNRARIFCPGFDMTNTMNAFAVIELLVSFTSVIAYWAITLSLLGIFTPATSPLAACTSVA